jgi:protein-L-isoaspartate(D-aspartate) O-methyltransferase
MHAHAAENLLSSLPSDSEGGAMLDVGSGSGYRKLTRAIVAQADGVVAAVFHHLAPNAKVVGIEHIKDLAEWSKDNLRKDGVELGVGGVEIIHGDGRLGELSSSVLVGRKLRFRIASSRWVALMIWLIEAPFQIIHVGAAAPEIPQPLIDQVSFIRSSFASKLIIVGKPRADVHTSRERYSRYLPSSINEDEAKR